MEIRNPTKPRREGIVSKKDVSVTYSQPQCHPTPTKSTQELENIKHPTQEQNLVTQLTQELKFVYLGRSREHLDCL